MNPLLDLSDSVTRRYFFNRSACGLGAAALASTINPQLLRGESTPVGQTFGSLPALHVPPKAKRVIWLFMADAPS